MSNKYTSVYDWLKYIKANVVGINLRELRLTRLVEALESINNNLSDIAVSLDGLDKNIDGCVSCSRDGRSKYLCISGDVYTN